MKFGKIYGRFFLKQHLDQPDDDTPRYSYIRCSYRELSYVV